MHNRELRHALKEIVLRQNYLYKSTLGVTNEHEPDPFLRDCSVLEKLIKDD